MEEDLADPLHGPRGPDPDQTLLLVRGEGQVVEEPLLGLGVGTLDDRRRARLADGRLGLHLERVEVHAVRRGHREHDRAVAVVRSLINMISSGTALVMFLLALAAAIGLLRRHRPSNQLRNLGAVSQQWLLVHKGDDR